MSAEHLIAELSAAGVQLWEDAGQLRYRAPKGTLTPDRIARLRAAKEDVLAALRSDLLPTIVPDPENRFEPFPLTDVQAAYLVGRQQGYAYGGVACHLYMEIEHSSLDPVRLEQGWNRLIEHHDMLRLVVHQEGYQQVLPTVPRYRIPVVDLRGESAGSVEARLSKERDELGNKVHPTGEWPLFELRVTQTPDRAILHLSLDFLMADWTSIQRLLGQLDRLQADPRYVLPPCEITYRDYVLAERALLESPRYRRDRDYWLERIDDLPPAPELPATTKLDAEPTFSRHDGALAAPSWASFRERAGTAGLTASGAVMAAFADVVGRFSRRPECTLNLTLHNRLPLHPQMEALFGDFTSVTLLAVRPGHGESFAERARGLGRRLFDDMDHRLYSGIEIIRELVRRRSRDEAVMPVVYTSAIRGAGDEEAAGEVGFSITQTPQVWIDCQVMERNGELLLNWNVRDEVFPPGLVEAMFEAFEGLLGRLASGSAAWDDAAPVPLPVGQAARRAEVNATAGELPSVLLHEPVFDTARRHPDRTAVIDAEGAHTYRALAGRATAVEAALRAAGAAPGDIAAVALDKGVDQIAAVLGILAAGGVYLPIDMGQPAARRDVILRDSGARFIVSAEVDATVPREVRAIALDALPADAGLPDTHECRVASDDVAYVIYTSGSTGVPKGVVITHRAAANTIADIDDRFGIEPADHVLGLANLSFDLSVYDIFGPLGVGGVLVLPAPERRGDPGHWAELIERHEITVWNSVPAQLQMLGHYLDSHPALRTGSLRLALLSGDWIPVNLPDEIRARIPGMRLISLGGATEASIWSINYPIGDVDPGAPSIPYGYPLRNQTFHVLDPQLRDCPEWVAGELYIGGDGLAQGYLNDPGRTAERFLTHPVTGRRLYRTGDLGRYLPTGAIEFLGREDHQVKIRGHRVELAEVEAALLSHPAVRAAVVLVDGADALRRRLVAFVERDTAGPDAGEPQIEDHLRTLLPEYMCPAVVRTLPRLPVTENGKIDRRALTAELTEIAGSAPAPGGEPPREGLETVLAALWAELLHIERVGRDDDFFALGGNSLLSTQLVAQLRARVPQAAGMFFDTLVRQLLPAPTVAAMAEFLESQAEAPPETGAERTVSPLRRIGTGEREPAVLLVHDGTGELDRYSELSGLLDPGRKVYGLSAGHAEGYVRTPDEALIPRRATGYARLVRAENPAAVTVVGAGVAAVLALEVARALRDQGAEVGEVVLVDGYRVDEEVTDDLWLESLLAAELGLDSEELGHTPGEPVPDGHPLRSRGVSERLEAVGLAAGLRSRTPIGTRLDLFHKTVRALRAHDPQPYAGPVRLIDSGSVPEPLGKALTAELSGAGCADLTTVRPQDRSAMAALAVLLEGRDR
ncbi:amino acid adenylation domain-containing protein [Streptomyces sp. NBC_01506]|uniref:non-ribosomal peptide synthetase n=1 Tax=Streptomyces sp. NBC_01506 TaxID=2903887 RepID=UPI003866C8B1